MRSVIFTFCRMNPPTKGHEKLVREVTNLASKLDADHMIYLSQTSNPTTDPIPWKQKLRICRKAFSGVSICDDVTIKTPFQALEQLADNYEKAIMVVGSDQVKEFSDRMSLYATRWNIHLEVVSAGLRNNSGTVNGISASKLRKYALDGNREQFVRWLPTTLSSDEKKYVYDVVVKRLSR